MTDATPNTDAPEAQTTSRRRKPGPLLLLAIVVGSPLFLLLALVVGVALWWQSGAPGATSFAERLLDGRSLGRLGTLQVSGVQGDLRTRLTIDRLAIADREGEWLVVRRVDVRWQAETVLRRAAEVSEVTAASVDVLRRPTLAPQETRGGDQPVSVSIARFSAPLRIANAASTVGDLRYLADGALTLERDNGSTGKVALVALAPQREALNANWVLRGDSTVDLDLRLTAEGGGLVGELLEASPDRPVLLTVKADGTPVSGVANAKLSIASVDAFVGDAEWQDGAAGFTGKLDATTMPLLADLAQRIGPQLDLAGRIQPSARSARPIEASLRAANAEARLSGGVRDDGKGFVRDTTLTFSVPDLRRATQGAMAGRLNGNAALEGNLDDARLAGTYALSGVRTLAGSADRLQGMIEATATRTRLRFETEASATGLGLDSAEASQILGRGLSLEARGDYDRVDGLLNLGRARLVGAGGEANASGTIGQDVLALRGSLSLRNLSQVSTSLKGSAAGSWTLNRRGQGPLQASADLRASRFSTGIADADALIGSSPRLVVSALRGDAGPLIWSMTGRRASANGTLAVGDPLHLNGTWQVRGPVSAGPITMAGNASGTVGLVGSGLNVTSRIPSIDAGGQVFTGVAASLVWNAARLSEPMRVIVSGQGDYGPATATADLILTDSRTTLAGLEASYAGADVVGQADITEQGINGRFDLVAGPGPLFATGTAEGALILAASPRSTTIDTDLTLLGVSFTGVPMTINTGRLTAKGPLDELAFELGAAGRWNADPIELRAVGRADLLSETRSITARARGSVQGAPFRTLEPATLTLGPDGTRLSAKATWRDAEAQFEAALIGRSVDIDARIDKVPLGLISAPDRPLEGRADVVARLEGSGDRLTGTITATARQLRPRGAKPDEYVDANVELVLANGLARVNGTATSPDGLRATLTGSARVTANASPFGIVLNRADPIEGQLTASGPAAAAARFVTGIRGTVGGTVRADVKLSGTLSKPTARGTVELANGRLVDEKLGLRFEDATVRAVFVDELVTVEQASMTDGRGGTAQLSGTITLGETGGWRIRGALNRFSLVRSNATTVVASGPLSVTRDAEGVALGGDLVIDEARARLQGGATRPPTMEVIEINRPIVRRLGDQPPRGRSPTLPIRLALTIKADDGVRITGRGIDAEFALDTRVRGQLAAPVLTGTATLVRGRIDFAGQTFRLDEGRVTFAPDLMQSRLAMVATRETPDFTAIARLSGTLESPVIKLESEPSAPEDEILARVLFGRGVSALSAAESAQLALSLASLATGVEVNPATLLGNAIGLDRLAVATDETGFAGVAAGLQLAEAVYVEVTTGGRDGTVALVEWRPRPRIAVTLRTTQLRESSIALRWRSRR